MGKKGKTKGATRLRRRKVLVTIEHLEHGVRCSPTSSPIALALRDAFSEYLHHYVYQARGDKNRLAIMVNSCHQAFVNVSDLGIKRVDKFTRKFDELQPVRPFSFYATLEVR